MAHISRTRTFAVTAAALAAAFACANSAAAEDYPPAYNQKTQFLTNDPKPTMPVASKFKDQKLATGIYTWSQVDNTAHRSICLTKGTYTWDDFLTPGNGTYAHKSSLQDDHQDPPAVLNGIVDLKGWGLPSQDWTWGSELVLTQVVSSCTP
ncbi:hypothetical protein [Streptomyces sp. CA-111067]|uniref:hypothetical protein n=1 Tax=Streptomyces sp. CA-111067 TaxID=3240046 RepID=UPI003D97C4EB